MSDAGSEGAATASADERAAAVGEAALGEDAASEHADGDDADGADADGADADSDADDADGEEGSSDDGEGRSVASDAKPKDRAKPEPPPKAVPRSFPRWVIAAVAALGLVAFGVYWYGRQAPSELPGGVVANSALAAIPAGAMVLVTADLKALRVSPLAAPYLGGDRSVPGLGTIRQTCGFDPIVAVDEIAIGVPEAGETDFGISAIGSFTDVAILECAVKIIAGRGGNAVTSPIGRFRSVRDIDSPASGEIASRPGGLLVLGGGGYLRAMIDAADGAVPNAVGDLRHAELRTALAGFETVRATMVLSDQQRATVADEIQKSGGRAPAALAGIRSAALGVRLIESQASLMALVRTDGTSQALSIAGLLEESKNDARQGVAAQVLGLAPLLDRVKVSVESSDVRITLELSVQELESVIERAIQVRALLDATPDEAAPPPEERAPPPPQPSAVPSPSAAVSGR